MGCPKPLPVLPVKQIPIMGESEYVNKFASVSQGIQATEHVRSCISSLGSQVHLTAIV